MRMAKDPIGKFNERSDSLINISKAEKADIAAATAVSSYQHTFWIGLLSNIGKLGNQPPLQLLSAAVLGAGLLKNNKRLMRTGIRMIAANTLAGLAKNFLKQRIDRTRPRLLMEEGRYQMAPGSNGAHDHRSFPSGHSACAVAVGRALAREYPSCREFAHATAGIIAVSQIARLTHYPSDVAAGSALGYISEMLLSKILRVPGN